VISACPFIPMKDEDMSKCIDIAHEFAIKLAEEVVAPSIFLLLQYWFRFII